MQSRTLLPRQPSFMHDPTLSRRSGTALCSRGPGRPTVARILIVGFALLVSACGGGRNSVSYASGPAMSVEQASRAVVVQSELQLTVEAPGEIASSVRTIAETAGGIVESSRIEGEDRVELRLRIPAARLEGVLAELRTLGKVDREVQRTQDVTDQLSDLDARRQNLVEVRDRLRGYLEQATTLEDIITVEAELNRVQSELDILTARLERLQGQAAMSSLRVELTRKRTLGPLGAVVYGLAWTFEKLFFIR